MKERIIQHWITTAIGVGLILGGCAAVWFGKISVDNLLVIVPVGAGLILSKDQNPFNSNTDAK